MGRPSVHYSQILLFPAITCSHQSIMLLKIQAYPGLTRPLTSLILSMAIYTRSGLPGTASWARTRRCFQTLLFEFALDTQYSRRLRSYKLLLNCDLIIESTGRDCVYLRTYRLRRFRISSPRVLPLNHSIGRFVAIRRFRAYTYL